MTTAGLKFSANISMLFCEQPFLDRIDAARAAGFEAVECHFPYDLDRAEVRARLAANGLPMTGLNTAPGKLANSGSRPFLAGRTTSAGPWIRRWSGRSRSAPPPST